mmetsp:Transcript_7713/g.8945  ORF Transcript_7713/g.8945 Transcript_7713/m.8945 type:complete len:90 (+) Transcript_7713:1914-2183(+)
MPCETTFAPSAENRGAIEGGTSHTQGSTTLPTRLITDPDLISTNKILLLSMPNIALSKSSDIGENIVLQSLGLGIIGSMDLLKMKPPSF